MLDEPTAGMDKTSRERFYHLLHHSCAHHGKAILMVTHEEEDLEHYVDKHIHLMRKEDSPWRCFSYGFMQRAFITGLAMAMITPILGLFLILRRQSLLADTLSHVSLVGVSLGLLLGYNPTFMTLVVVVLAAIVLEVIGKYFKGYSEVTVAILMSGGMAIALILMNFQKGRSTISVDQFFIWFHCDDYTTTNGIDDCFSDYCSRVIFDF